MPYTPHSWQDSPSTTTPITATRLNEMEAGIVEGAQVATQTQAGNVELATSTEMTTATDTARVPSVAVIAAYITSRLTGGTGAVSSVQGRTGTVTLDDLFAAVSHTHTAADLTSGTLALARVAAGATIVVDKAKGGFGAAAGSWPAARPTSRTDVTVWWIGDTEPGSIAVNGDVKLITA